MRKLAQWIVGSLTALSLLMVPMAMQAKVATLDDMSCTSTYSDITPSDEFNPEERSEENYQVFWYHITIGDDCQMDVSFDENPLMVFVSGGEMDMESNWELNKEAKTATVNFTAREIQQIDSQVSNSFGDGETLTTVAFIWEAEQGNGPTSNTQDAWVATDFQEYDLITNPTKMGAQVQGDDGDAGLFAMYMPASQVDSMFEEHDDHDNEGYDAEEDMAIYLGDNEQTDQTVTVTEDGGTFISFEAEITADDEVDQNQGNGEGQDEFVDCDQDGEPDEGSEEFNGEGDPCAEVSSAEVSGAEVSVAGSGPVTVRVTAGPRDPAGSLENAVIGKKKLKIKNKKRKSVKLKWTAVEGADTYTVQVRKCKFEGKKKCSKKKNFVKKKKYRVFKNIEATSKVVKKLKPGVRYEWRVKACGQGECAEYSKWKPFRTKLPKSV